MSRIKNQNLKIKNEKRMGIMTHVVVGYPSLEETENLVITMEKEGADFVELQIPFSDPVADGPTILKASQQSLDNKTTVSDAFILAKNLRDKGVKIPLIFMTYANIVYAKGIEKFITESKKAGIDAFIIPDLPLDTHEGEMFFKLSQQNNLEMIPLFAPPCSDERLSFLGKHAKNIVYAVARTGVTGSKTDIKADIEKTLTRFKKHTSVDIALGFGIQSKEQIMSLKEKVETVVIGTAILKIFEKGGVDAVAKFMRDLK